MYVFLIIITLIELVFGVSACFQPNGWMYGVPIIISCLIMFYLAGGADAAYRHDKKLEGVIPVDVVLKDEQDRFLKSLCNKLNVSYEEVQQLAIAEEIEEKKDIPLEELPRGSKVVLIKDRKDSPHHIKAGTIGVLMSHRKDSAYWTIRMTTKAGEHIFVSCLADEIKNYYQYLFEQNQNGVGE